MKMLRILCLACVVCIHVQCAAQQFTTYENADKKTIKAYDEALALRNGGEPEKAISKLEGLLKSAPEFIDAPLTLAEMYYLSDRLPDAVLMFERAIALDSFYMPRALYSLGRISLQIGEFTKAKQLLERYIHFSSAQAEHKANAAIYLEKARFGEMLMMNPVPFDPEPIPGPINTPESEALPAFTIDGQYMLYTRNVRGEDLYIAYWDSLAGHYGAPERMDGVNTTFNEGAHAVSADGSMIAFTSCGRLDGLGACDLYFWQRKDGKWLRPVNAGGINTKGWDGHPALTSDGRGLYFSSDRPGGAGGRDIWYTERHGDRWTRPINLEGINTPGNEESPFLYFDNRTLYFMSDGHPGMGDFDIFSSTKTGWTWSKPKNLGYPINTIGKEGALTIHPNREYAYFTSDRKTGQDDIYRFKLDSSLLPPLVSNLQGVVTDASTGAPIIADIVVYDPLDSLDQLHYTTDIEGKFSTVIVHGRPYGIHVVAQGYAFYSDQVMVPDTLPYGQYLVKVPLTSLKRDVETKASSPIVLRNIEFESGSAKLLSSSTQELNLLHTLLTENPDIHIDIHGHTDNVGEEADNQILSEARARAVYDWLITKGIAASRLSFKGFGETRPIDTNETAEGRQQNRRTEFVVR